MAILCDTEDTTKKGKKVPKKRLKQTSSNEESIDMKDDDAESSTNLDSQVVIPSEVLFSPHDDAIMNPEKEADDDAREMEVSSSSGIFSLPSRMDEFVEDEEEDREDSFNRQIFQSLYDRLTKSGSVLSISGGPIVSEEASSQQNNADSESDGDDVLLEEEEPFDEELPALPEQQTDWNPGMVYEFCRIRMKIPSMEAYSSAWTALKIGLFTVSTLSGIEDRINEEIYDLEEKNGNTMPDENWDQEDVIRYQYLQAQEKQLKRLAKYFNVSISSPLLVIHSSNLFRVFVFINRRNQKTSGLQKLPIIS